MRVVQDSIITAPALGITVPAPGQADLPAPNAAELLRANASDPVIGAKPAIHWAAQTWTHGEYVAESQRWAQLFLSRRQSRADGSDDRPLHVGLLLDNTPDYLFALGGAALSGSTIVGMNHTRVGEHLLRDLIHTDVDLLITEPTHLPEVEAIAGQLNQCELLVSNRFPSETAADQPKRIKAGDLEAALTAVSDADPGIQPSAETPWALIFTSGTTSAPKAVICSQRRLLTTGNRLASLLELGPTDVGYICMPLFHSNALMVGWMPSLVAGCAVGLRRKFSASHWLEDVRQYQATYFNYTGKPLSYLVATAELADDAENSLRVAFGNEGSPQVIEQFSERFGVKVIDAFGSTEGAIAVNRDAVPRQGAMGIAGESIAIISEQGEPCAAAEFDAAGSLLNPAECIGEIVNTAGAGPFEGYYNNDEATAAATRKGWYWSGDLGYLDQDRYLYFAGRTSDWIRVDGENFASGPIDAALSSHPDFVLAVAYGVPDVHAGDQVMAAVVMRPETEFDPSEFAVWLDGSAAVMTKWRPRYVRVAQTLPTTGTNKVLTRRLSTQKYRRSEIGSDQLWVRERGDAVYREFTSSDEQQLHTELQQAGRLRFWDI